MKWGKYSVTLNRIIPYNQKNEESPFCTDLFKIFFIRIKFFIRFSFYYLTISDFILISKNLTLVINHPPALIIPLGSPHIYRKYSSKIPRTL